MATISGTAAANAAAGAAVPAVISSGESSFVLPGPEKLVKLRNSIQNGEKPISVDLTNCRLTVVPKELFELADCLEVLNLGNNDIDSVPPDFDRFVKLRVLFFGQNKFAMLPSVLGKLTSLYMLSFKSNQISHIPQDSLSPSIGWLILTDNKINNIPASIGNLPRLQKLMLAGNCLRSLPTEMANCRELELVRLACNRLDHLPQWLVTLPKLSWLAFSGNPCCTHGTNSTAVDSSISSFSWKDISLGAKLGEGASGYVYKADWTNGIGTTREVAVKLFKGEATSDGSPEDEMKVSESCLSAQCCCDDPRGFRCVSKQVTIHVWCQPLQNIKRMVMMPRVRKR
jgi:hypothetical protein